MNVEIQVDFTGAAGHMPGEDWVTVSITPGRSPLYLHSNTNRLQMGSIDVAAAGSSSYGFYVFPTGFSAHWVRLVTDTTTTCTAIFHYT